MEFLCSREKIKPAQCVGFAYPCGLCGTRLGLNLGLDSIFFGLFDGFADNALEAVYLVLDVVAELEGGDHAFFNLDGLAGARVACGAGLARLASERAESADFDGVTFDELFSEEVEELLNDSLDVVTHKSGGLGDILNQGLFCYVGHD